MNIHDRPGVLPGRYAGEPIRVHDGPTPEQSAYEGQRKHADALAGKICAAAADATRSQYVLLELLGRVRRHECDPPLDRFQVLGALAGLVLLDDTRRSA